MKFIISGGETLNNIHTYINDVYRIKEFYSLTISTPINTKAQSLPMPIEVFD